ncbi:uncharacterized protein LOC143663311 isoform X2 [Tamandua tetradactyla]
MPISEKGRKNQVLKRTLICVNKEALDHQKMNDSGIARTTKILQNRDTPQQVPVVTAVLTALTRPVALTGPVARVTPTILTAPMAHAGPCPALRCRLRLLSTLAPRRRQPLPEVPRLPLATLLPAAQQRCLPLSAPQAMLPPLYLSPPPSLKPRQQRPTPAQQQQQLQQILQVSEITDTTKRKPT